MSPDPIGLLSLVEEGIVTQTRTAGRPREDAGRGRRPTTPEGGSEGPALPTPGPQRVQPAGLGKNKRLFFKPHGLWS